MIITRSSNRLVILNNCPICVWHSRIFAACHLWKCPHCVYWNLSYSFCVFRFMYSYPIWLWGSPPTISLRYRYSYPIWLWGSSPQSLSGICTLIQSDYDGPPTISLRYMYSYPIGLWGSPHHLPQVYELLCNLTMMVPPQSPSGICTLIQSDYEGPPQFPSGICTLIQSDYEGPSPQSPSGICTVIQSDYDDPPTISLKYMYSYPIWLWWSPTISLRYMYSYPIWLMVPHNLPQVYVLLSNLTMRVPPQSPSSICTLFQSAYDGPPTISLRYMYS
jgi:hypothetical protein